MNKQYIYTLYDPISKEIRYVGKSNNPEERLKRHLSDYSLCESWTDKNKWLLHLKNKNLLPLMTIIDTGNDSNIDELEIKWISYYKNTGLKLLNMTDGGDGFNWRGKKHTNESIEKLKLCSPFRKEIIQFTLENEVVNIFNSMHECEKITGLSRTHISKCCHNGKNKTVGGYYFRFIDNYFPCIKSKSSINLDMLNKIISEFNDNKKSYITKKEELKIKLKKLSNSRKKPVVQYDLNGNILNSFDSMSDAKNKTGCHIGLISKCCNFKSYFTVKGTTFRYEEDQFDYLPYNYSIQITSKKICKYDLDGKLIKIYDSIKQACRENNIVSDSNIISCCRRKINKKNGKFIMVKGHTYRFFNDTKGDDLPLVSLN